MPRALNPGDQDKVLAWLVERVLPDPPIDMTVDWSTCANCGHRPHFHRQSGPTVANPAIMYRCIWPSPDGPEVEMCACPGYVRGPNIVAAGQW